jgi:hypothetical protein
MTLLSTRNKGRPSTKEAAHKKKEHEVVEMVWLSQYNKNPQDDDTSCEQEVHTPLTGTEDTASIFLDALEVREALRVEDGERVLLAVAWVCDDERRLFHLFPEVTFWDSAQKTNREKRPLFLLRVQRILNITALRTSTRLCLLNASGCLSGCKQKRCQVCLDL